MNGKFPALSDDQKRELEKEYTTKETWKALRGLGALKAPGPDGFQATFFRGHGGDRSSIG